MDENHEKIIGEAWFNGVYDQTQAELTCEFQGLSWEKVMNEYCYQYELSEKAGALSWN